MNTILQQTARARRRLLLQRFGTWFSWALFTCMLIAVAGTLAPKVWPVEFDSQTWFFGWIIGAVVTALLVALLGTFLGGPSLDLAAQEVDRRFGLRERLSSSLSLSAMERETPAGQALLADASKRAEHLEIPEQFALKGHPRGLLPLLPAALLAAVYLVPDAAAKASVAAQNTNVEARQVKNATEQLKKQLEQRRRTAEAKGLEEAGELFKQIEAGVDKLQAKDATDRKEALVKLNELKDQLEQKRSELGNTEQLKNNLANLKNLDQGPGEKLAKQLEKGEFGKASQELKQLADQLKNGELSPEQQQQLQKQVEQMQQQLQKMTERHEQAKQDLKEQIEKAKEAGNTEQAAKLQEKLEQMQKQDGAMQKMQQMAEAMKQAAEKMQQGDQKGAAEQMEQLGEQLDKMQAELEQLEDLEGALDQFNQAKDSMRCDKCDGDGCEACQGGQGKKGGEQWKEQDWAKGGGQGAGKRDIADDETNTYQSQVRDKAKQGKAIVSGTADGPNRKGVTQESVKEAIQAGTYEKSDPVEDRPLPRTEREHTRSYFDQLREGNP